MIDIVLILIIAVIVFAAGGYVYRAKRNGVKCVGCPIARTCAVKDAVVRKGTSAGRSSSCCGASSGRSGVSDGFRKTTARGSSTTPFIGSDPQLPVTRMRQNPLIPTKRNDPSRRERAMDNMLDATELRLG